jgi:hypothetical protein
MSQIDHRQIAIDTFEKIRAAFPYLTMTIDLHHPHVDINVDIKKQTGLDFDVNLNLQNIDELHLSAGSFWVEWFPCDEPQKVEDYLSAVKGLLSGEYRIREHRRGDKVFKAELQRPVNTNWETIATWSRLRWPSFRKKTFNMVQNKSALPATQ